MRDGRKSAVVREKEPLEDPEETGADAELAAICETLEKLGQEKFEGRHAGQMMTAEAEKRTRKEIKRELCCGPLAKERDAVCKKLREAGICVLRQGELEEYVGLAVTGSRGGMSARSSDSWRCTAMLPRPLS